MNRDEALEALGSADVRERLGAARILARTAVPADRERLEACRRVETVPWVRNALERAVVSTAVRGVAPSRQNSDVEESAAVTDPVVLAETVHAAAIQEVSDRLVHELRKVLGRVRFFAGRELDDPGASRTMSHLNRMQDLLDGIQSLGDAASVAAAEEVDLEQLLAEEVDGLGVGTDAVELVGQSPAVVRGDPALLRLAVSNGLKNAVEASQGDPRAGPVVVAWGTTDVDNWIAILDKGPGVPESTDALFSIGESTKRGHSGLGLAVAQRAARSLGGDVILGNDQRGMTRFELRWPTEDAL